MMSELSLRSNLAKALRAREPVIRVLPPGVRDAEPPAPMVREDRVWAVGKMTSAEPVLSVLTLTASGPVDALMIAGAVGAVSLTLMVATPGAWTATGVPAAVLSMV